MSLSWFVLGCVGLVLGCLAPVWGCLGPVLRLSWVLLGLSGAVSGPRPPQNGPRPPHKGPKHLQEWMVYNKSKQNHEKLQKQMKVPRKSIEKKVVWTNACRQNRVASDFGPSSVDHVSITLTIKLEITQQSFGPTPATKKWPLQTKLL